MLKRAIMRAVPIVPFRHKRPVNNELVLVLAQLLKEAQTGELVAMAYVAKNRFDGCSADAVGPSPEICLGLARQLADKLAE